MPVRLRYGWGYAADGRTGLTSPPAQQYHTTPSPALMDGNGSWVSVSLGPSGHGAGIREDGSLWTWGLNAFGELGRTGDAAIPGQIPGAWKQVVCGNMATLAINVDGSLWACGYNAQGTLGIGNTTNKSVLTRVGTANDWVEIACTWNHVFAIKGSDRQLYGWGLNMYGQLGLGDGTNRLSPTRIGALVNWSTVAAGEWHSLAIHNSTDVYVSGYGYYELGSPSFGGSAVTLTKIPEFFTLAGSKILAHRSTSMLLRPDGVAYVWGANEYGQLGLGNTTPKDTPTLLSGTWLALSTGGQHTFGIKRLTAGSYDSPTQGALFAWGKNTSYELGLGNTTQRTSPTQVGSSTKWDFVQAGFDCSVALSLSTTWRNMFGQREA